MFRREENTFENWGRKKKEHFFFVSKVKDISDKIPYKVGPLRVPFIRFFRICNERVGFDEALNGSRAWAFHFNQLIIESSKKEQKINC